MRGTTQKREDPGRTAAEWTTLVISLLILSAVVAVIGLEVFEDRNPAEPVARVERTAREGDAYVIDVEVTNEGDETAANVQVTASLEVDGDVSEADQVIDFLAGGADDRLAFVFTDNPADGELTVEVSSFARP